MRVIITAYPLAAEARHSTGPHHPVPRSEYRPVHVRERVLLGEVGCERPPRGHALGLASTRLLPAARGQPPRPPHPVLPAVVQVQRFGPLSICRGGTVTFTWVGMHGVFQIPTIACPSNFTAGQTDDYQFLAAASNGGQYVWQTPNQTGHYWVTSQYQDDCRNGAERRGERACSLPCAPGPWPPRRPVWPVAGRPMQRALGGPAPSAPASHELPTLDDALARPGG